MQIGNVKFGADLRAQLLIKRIVERAKRKGLVKNIQASIMDIEATHMNGCPLDLQRFVDAPEASFERDFKGIARNLDRTTGKLQGGFKPNCALPPSANEA